MAQTKNGTPPASGDADSGEPAAPAEPQLFVAKVSTLGAVTLRKGEVAVDGASILKTHGHLFEPLPITYHA